MVGAGIDGRGRAAGAEVDRREVVPHLIRAVADTDGVALPELPGAVVAPALHGAVVEQSARAVGAG